ncbi:polysaccharide biosynthesis/export family protein [Marinobacterium sedimentorum]|uniref:polysaccharide biosynthesis/export family protein n=1 Tax=Marinobacterium sedimentorum TaxID=2927804 RepID=UPI0020C6C42C|nr:polysaccharide biosynthesis/export family protein [Marinobacterium sedimentorum]MCP8688665.1 polysaccharide export protein [Marinobacterium sedimentorum]
MKSVVYRRITTPFVFAAILSTVSSLASAIGFETSVLPESEQAQVIPEKVDDQVKTNWRTGTYAAPAPLPPAMADSTEIRPFGADLFTGGFRGVRADGLNSTYRLVPGDQITLRIWGAVEFERVLPVDAQGNIFLPAIGPVMVQGLTNGELNSRVTRAVRSVYPENVQVYTNLQGVQPVAVFVTGYVTNPGRYAGTPSDSLLYFLDQAGGIDAQLGSYRQVTVLRDKKVIANADLYDFLLNGNMARLQFQDGDTVVVAERGPAVTVTGDVERSYRYELANDRMNGAALLDLARLKPDVSHVLLRGGRTDGPISLYYSLSEFPQQTLNNGDEVLFSADRRDETIVVQLEGSYYGPSRYALPKSARLNELLDAVAVPRDLTAVQSISLRRVSVAEQQKQALQESLRRLETTYLGAPSATPQEAQVRVQEAELITQFVARASQVEPSGRLVVAHNDRITDIRLQDGDVITLPELSDSLLISGEVLVPQSVVFTPGVSVEGYIEGAGGYTQHADDDHILVVRQNGEVRDANDVDLRPGDEILVLPAVPTKNLQLATSISQIIFQIAVAAKVALD